MFLMNNSISIFLLCIYSLRFNCLVFLFKKNFFLICASSDADECLPSVLCLSFYLQLYDYALYTSYQGGNFLYRYLTLHYYKFTKELHKNAATNICTRITIFLLLNTYQVCMLFIHYS